VARYWHIIMRMITTKTRERKTMEYRKLTETQFFKIVYGEMTTSDDDVDEAYHGFIAMVIELCGDNGAIPHLALMFAEVELSHHGNDNRLSDNVKGYVRKAHSFVCNIQRHIAEKGLLTNGHKTDDKDSVPQLKWTGNAVDLVEMVYGINVMGCVNDGKTPLKDMATLLYNFFGVNAKDCYRFYIDIRRRKNDDRTYFLNEMCERLNEKMKADDRKEMARK